MAKEKKTCFVISPIGPIGSNIRIQSDKVYNNLILQSIDKEKFDIERADLIDRSGIAMNMIFEKIERSDLIIADITDGNPNVFYELAIRHATRLPCIVIGSHETIVPFDIGGVSVIYYNLLSIESVFDSIAKLKRAVDNFLFSSENPFSLYVSSKRTPAGATSDQGRGGVAGEFFKKISAMHGQQIKRFEGIFLSYKYSIYTHNSPDHKKPFLMTPVQFKCNEDYIDIYENAFDDDPWSGFGVVSFYHMIGLTHASSRTADTLAMVIAVPESKKPKFLYGAELYVNHLGDGKKILSRPVIYIRYEESEEMPDGYALNEEDIPDAAKEYLLSENKISDELIFNIEGSVKAALLLRAGFGFS